MKSKYLCILLLLSITVNTVFSQNEDELPPSPDQPESEGFIEGSGDGVVDEPATTTISTTEASSPPKLESVEGSRIIFDEEHVPNTDSNNTELPCPKPCVCHTEGDTANFIVDCSGYGLTEFPSPIDPRTTTLKLHNNKLTEIPKSISELKSLKILNANNNLIMELAPGSISELPQLVTLNLGNNRLIEYPKDLKNSISLSKLEELDLGGNDMRTKLSSENFSNFKALRKITLPTGPTELALDLCESLKETLETVCTESCDKPFDCPDAPEIIEDDLFDATLPGMIPLNTFGDTKEVVTETEKSVTESTSTTTTPSKPLETESTLTKNIPASEFSLRTAVNNAPEEKVEKIASLNAIPDSTKDVSSATNVKVGATTVDTKQTGGVDKSVIGMVVAGMIVIVAGITIKKNWSSIKKRFSSTTNRPNERPGGNANGTAPEEVPLQNKSDKLPV